MLRTPGKHPRPTPPPRKPGWPAARLPLRTLRRGQSRWVCPQPARRLLAFFHNARRLAVQCPARSLRPRRGLRGGVGFQGWSGRAFRAAVNWPPRRHQGPPPCSASWPTSVVAARADLILALEPADPATRRKRAADLDDLTGRVRQLVDLRPLLPLVLQKPATPHRPTCAGGQSPADAVVDFLAYTFVHQDPARPAAGLSRTPAYLAFVLTAEQASSPASSRGRGNIRWAPSCQRQAITGPGKQVPADLPRMFVAWVWEKVPSAAPPPRHQDGVDLVHRDAEQLPLALVGATGLGTTCWKTMPWPWCPTPRSCSTDCGPTNLDPRALPACWSSRWRRGLRCRAHHRQVNSRNAASHCSNRANNSSGRS